MTVTTRRPPDRPGASSAALGIGEVLSRLRPEFPDVTISKIRFLETEGLVEPERTPSGYRKFTQQDLERLRYVLACQRDRYLPLRVIREHLAAVDRGEESPYGDPIGEPDPGARSDDSGAGSEAPGADLSELRLSRREIAQAAGLDPEQFAELERFGLVAPRPGGVHYDGDALTVARTVAAMARYGVEPRHIRAMKVAADREVGLIEQVVRPLTRQRGGDAQERAHAALRDLAALSLRLHAALVRAGLSAEFGS